MQAIDYERDLTFENFGYKTLERCVCVCLCVFARFLLFPALFCRFSLSGLLLLRFLLLFSLILLVFFFVGFFSYSCALVWFFIVSPNGNAAVAA